jgi:hypothetical protein
VYDVTVTGSQSVSSFFSKNHRVLFAIQTLRNRAIRFTSTLDGSRLDSIYDYPSGLVVAYASRTDDGWFSLSTHQNEPNTSTTVEFPDTITRDGVIGNRGIQVQTVSELGCMQP